MTGIDDDDSPGRIGLGAAQGGEFRGCVWPAPIGRPADRPLELGLELAMEFCADDECVEVTPEIVRVRKVELDATSRARSRSRAKARG